jgi:hypothetical protein
MIRYGELTVPGFMEASKGSKNMEVSQSSWGYPMTTGWFMKLPQTCSTLALDVFAEPSIF